MYPVCVAQLSGGYDSALAADLTAKLSINDLHLLFYRYGAVYEDNEYESAHYASRTLAERYPNLRIHFQEFKLPLMLRQADTPDAYVPMRNLAFAAHSANYALAVGSQIVTVGSKSAHKRAGDPYSFSDSTRLFYQALNLTTAVAAETDSVAVEFVMPLSGWQKSAVVKGLADMGYVLDRLWCCYLGGSDPCGECYHCGELTKAKKEAGIAE